MQNYPSALLIIQNATELDIDLESVSNKINGTTIKTMSAKECFDFSLSYFDMDQYEKVYKYFPEQLEYLEYIKKNIAASKELQKIFESKIITK